jgi:hypothetical protein
MFVDPFMVEEITENILSLRKEEINFEMRQAIAVWVINSKVQTISINILDLN